MGALTTLRRAGTVVAAATAFGIAGATVASAHHCYRDVWMGGSYAQISTGKTAWMPLSDLGTMFLLGPEYAEQCGYVVDDAVAAWMDEVGMEQEPLIHMRATVGGGAFYHTGKEPQPFSYLSDADFGLLTMAVVEGMAVCAPEWSLPE